jgi:hypothetical protein
MRVSRWETAGAAAVVCAALLACVEGGANSNQKGVGDQPGGVKLGTGDFAVAPVGDYVIFDRDDTLAVGHVDTGAIETLPLTSPTRLAFSKKRPVVYVGTNATNEIVAVDVDQKKALWHRGVIDAGVDTLRIESSRDDRFVLAGSSEAVEVLDAATGALVTQVALDRGLVDAEILGDSKRALFVEQHQWDGEVPHTRVTVLNLETLGKTQIDVPNCADDIVVSADGTRAFLAPTTCSHDPVSIIDLSAGNEHYQKNRPGFGPVAMSPDGTTAVAFVDRTQADTSLFDDPAQVPDSSTPVYHIMLIDSVSLKYELVPYANVLPRFAVTPDGNVLLVDSGHMDGAPARLLDVPSRSFRDIQGPEVVLDDFVLTSDSRHAYALNVALADLDIENATSSLVDPGFTPKNLNISADDQALFLRRSDSEICVFDLAQRYCKRSFVTTSAP